MRSRKRYLVFMAAVVPLAGLSFIRPGGVTVVHAFNPFTAPLIQARLLDSAADISLHFHSPEATNSVQSHALTTASSLAANYQPGPNGECPVSLGGNIKVNQNCLNVSAQDLQGRGQAQNETAIAVNPENSLQLIAASNDYQLGDGLAGGIAFSSDGGKHWQDSQVPLEFTRGSDFSGNSNARMYWQGGGDPSLAWDTHNNAYFAGEHFNRGPGTSDNPDASSAIYVHRSTGNGGASWNFPGTPVVTSYCPNASTCTTPFLDKPYMTIDDSSASSFTNRIYVTWTSFASDGTAYIYEANSSDFGRTFSSPVAVTNVSDSATLCPNTFGLATPNGSCNENQFSDPFTDSHGNLYVVYDNYNNGVSATPTCPHSGAKQPCDNHNQVLLSESTNGGVSFLPAVQVAEFNDLPDCATYQNGQDAFRSCVPEKGTQQDSVFRAANYPSGAATGSGASEKIAVTFGSYISADSNPNNSPGSGRCAPAGLNPTTGLDLYTGVKTAGDCSNKILESTSSDGGATFSGLGADPSNGADDVVIPQGTSQAHTDQWFQWAAINSSGKLAVSYYDRQYGSDTTNGAMDITLSTSTNLSTFSPTRVTSGSMPLPTQFPDSQGNSVFFGDYSGLAASASQANPLWSDTRDENLFDCGTNPPAVCTGADPNGIENFNDQDIFTDNIGI